MSVGYMYLWGFLILLALIIIAQFGKYPGQWLWKLVRAAAIGCLLVFAVNTVGHFFHYHLPFNPVTALTAGILGIPGVAAMVAIQLWALA